MNLAELRQTIREHTLCDEAALLRKLIADCALSVSDRRNIAHLGTQMVRQMRETRAPTLIEKFFAEFGVSNKEGVALMCLAEALLRVPDSDTIDALIADKIAPSNWRSHLGKADSTLVNASAWALMLAGRILSAKEEKNLMGFLSSLTRRLGEPVIRTAIGQAMKEVGRQFVLAENIDDALLCAQKMEAKGYFYSYDMLGEAALTIADANRYYAAYGDAIDKIAALGLSADSVWKNPSISVKLSALYPRYETRKKPFVLDSLITRTTALALAAKAGNMGFNIDAEEANRLDISLDVIENVLSNKALSGWPGFGVVVQAYGKRATFILDWLNALASSLKRKIMVRLVKGAYWDSEIKDAQVDGLADYPVLTRKYHTDISYIACAKKLLSMREHIYPQFATHNAHTVAAVCHLAKDYCCYEFQRLHGMGGALHEEIKKNNDIPLRIYAPVGRHEDLLAYLVRRMLENGANSSFIHQLLDKNIPPEAIAVDPFAKTDGKKNQRIVGPPDLFAEERQNAKGWNIQDPVDLANIQKELSAFVEHQWRAYPLVADGDETTDIGKPCKPCLNPAERQQQVGVVAHASAADIQTALSAAAKAADAWAAYGFSTRAAILDKTADLYEQHAAEFFSLLIREAGKTIDDCVGEVREAVDFIRYYAANARRTSGEAHGVFVCISPWNFPLAIFSGQVAAALAAGNTVIAKPAEQTPLIAMRATQLLHQAGVPKAALQLLPGDGLAVGASLVADSRVGGVCFTGSTATARSINRTMAKHLSPNAVFIAETGGINAMLVDSTALLEQAVTDIIASAFQSAGQRCSALRVLYVQKDIAAQLLQMLRGAMECLKTANPCDFDSDIGPLIDDEAHATIANYAGGQQHGLLFPPTIIETDGIASVQNEIFGPVLHVARFAADEIDRVIDDINACGYGLTFGIHSRVDKRIQHLVKRIHVGNVYVNRNQIGAVVGSQPFGGMGLSGTGPKAGGPNYLSRFLKTPSSLPIAPTVLVASAKHITASQVRVALGKLPPVTATMQRQKALPGPTGESNVLFYVPKGNILILGADEDSVAAIAQRALAAGNAVLVVALVPALNLAATLAENPAYRFLHGWLAPAELKKLRDIAVVVQLNPDDKRETRQALAAQDGAIVPMLSAEEALTLTTAFVHEKHLCINTTAAGGNAELMTQAE